MRVSPLRTTRHRLSGVAAAAVLLVFLAAGCEPSSLRITTDPGLYPGFSTAISDYVSRCNASDPVDVSVSAPSNTTVSVDGQQPRSGSFTTQVTRDVGQRFTLVVRADSKTTTHHVRCLPGDFPAWSSQRTGATQAEWYVTAAAVGITGANYPVVFDNNGVPVWWGPKTAQFFTLPLNGNIAWFAQGRIEEHRLDGSLVRTYSTVEDPISPGGDPMDFHDLEVLPNGNHLAVTITEKPDVDLSSWGGPPDATIIDHIVQEVTPQGVALWQWRTSDHIDIDETTPGWRAAEVRDPGGPFYDVYDPFHWNSVEWTGDGVILSFRHDDAIYKVNRLTGLIEWKLGGTTTPESLTVVGDPVFQSGGGGGFGGQHDARLLEDGTVTLYDNGSLRNRPPRSPRYRLDLSARTATLVRVVRDSLEPTSFCCGSARVLPGGNYVFGWGGNGDNPPDITENTRSGARLFELSFTGKAPAQAIVYRGIPVPPGQLSRAALRAGMDSQHP
jgi:hypothetical protein